MSTYTPHPHAHNPHPAAPPPPPAYRSGGGESIVDAGFYSQYHASTANPPYHTSTANAPYHTSPAANPPPPPPVYSPDGGGPSLVWAVPPLHSWGAASGPGWGGPGAAAGPSSWGPSSSSSGNSGPSAWGTAPTNPLSTAAYAVSASNSQPNLSSLPSTTPVSNPSGSYTSGPTPSSGPAGPTSSGPSGPSSSARGEWKAYMASLGGLARLDLGDKPLPPLPLTDPKARPASMPPAVPPPVPPPSARVGAYPSPVPGPPPLPPASTRPKPGRQGSGSHGSGASSASGSITTSVAHTSAYTHAHTPPRGTKKHPTTPPSTSPTTTKHTHIHSHSPPRAFRPSFHPLKPRPSQAAHLLPPRHQRAASVPSTSTSGRPRASKAVIDLTGSSDESESEAEFTDSSDETPRRKGSTARQASSTLAPGPRKPKPRSAPTTPQRRGWPPKSSSQSQSKSSSQSQSKSSSQSQSQAQALPAVRCAGFTRQGQPCKRLVRVGAPFVTHGLADSDGDDATARAVGRFCKDHAGLVCAAPGFYWRDGRGKAGVYVDFGEYIPAELGQQTQTLLRMTMESPLTAKELPGFLYAYELRDLAETDTTYFKVGRTDNVPRRIGQWSNQCTSHTPTLRDVFPLRAAASNSTLARAPSVLGSLLPGAVKAGTDAHRMVPAVKRWERLVHLELAERATSDRAQRYDALLQPCADCGALHREIFPLAEDGEAYDLVVEVIGRWERFVRAICA